MDRRLAGLLVVVASVVVAAAIAVTRPPVTHASRTIGPDPPAVGDCIDPVVTAGPGEPRRTAAPERSFGSCTGGHLGEIVAVRLRPSADPQHDMPDATGCRTDLMRAAGLRPSDDRFVLPGDDPADPVAWTYSVNAQTSWIWQWPHLPPEANDWAACVAIARVHGADAGAIGNAYNGGSLPANLGACWAPGSAPGTMTPTDCTVAHTAERITTGMVKAPDLTGPATAKDSCTRQAAQVTGHVDPTMGGRLTVSLTISGIDHAEFSIQRAVDCVLITADGRRILGSLVGLDDQPLHYAG